MNKNFTQDNVIDKKKEVKDNGPKESTLAFLKQFARVYTCEKKLEGRMCDLVMN